MSTSLSARGSGIVVSCPGSNSPRALQDGDGGPGPGGAAGRGSAAGRSHRGGLRVRQAHERVSMSSVHGQVLVCTPGLGSNCACAVLQGPGQRGPVPPGHG